MINYHSSPFPSPTIYTYKLGVQEIYSANFVLLVVPTTLILIAVASHNLVPTQPYPVKGFFDQYGLLSFFLLSSFFFLLSSFFFLLSSFFFSLKKYIFHIPWSPVHRRRFPRVSASVFDFGTFGTQYFGYAKYCTHCILLHYSWHVYILSSYTSLSLGRSPHVVCYVIFAYGGGTMDIKSLT